MFSRYRLRNAAERDQRDCCEVDLDIWTAPNSPHILRWLLQGPPPTEALGGHARRSRGEGWTPLTPSPPVRAPKRTTRLADRVGQVDVVAAQLADAQRVDEGCPCGRGRTGFADVGQAQAALQLPTPETTPYDALRRGVVDGTERSWSMTAIG